MAVRAGRILIVVLAALCGPLAAPALASWAGSDPSSNFSVGSLPSACETNPTGAVCIGASVSYLDQARARLGQPAYALPSDFVSLSPPQQVLVLTNLDRTLYNLPPITGVTDALDQDAAAAVPSDSDPQPSTSEWYGYTSNAAWGDENIVLAYEGWMYDDGPGSGNVDCTSSDPSGCWGHRHDILWQFGPGALAMGAAAGTDSGGNPSYTMLLMQGSPTYTPAYTYTWSQALADGAAGASGSAPTSGSGSSSSPGSSSAGQPAAPAGTPVARGAQASIRILRLSVHGHRITVRLAAPPGALLRCSLTRVRGRVHRVKSCTQSVIFSHLRAGRYRLRITSGPASVTRRVVLR
jgi:hypothetical protein